MLFASLAERKIDTVSFCLAHRNINAWLGILSLYRSEWCLFVDLLKDIFLGRHLSDVILLLSGTSFLSTPPCHQIMLWNFRGSNSQTHHLEGFSIYCWKVYKARKEGSPCFFREMRLSDSLNKCKLLRRHFLTIGNINDLI